MDAGDARLRQTVAAAVDRGIISEEQAGQLIALAAAHPPAESRLRPLVAEALGHVGGALALVAVIVISEQFWAGSAALGPCDAARRGGRSRVGSRGSASLRGA